MYEQWKLSPEESYGWRKYFPTLQVSVLAVLPLFVFAAFIECTGLNGCASRNWLSGGLTPRLPRGFVIKS